MVKYAQLNDEYVVIGISQLSGAVIADNMILIDDLDVGLGSTYNRETGEFSPPEPHPNPEPKATIEEVAEETLLETKYQTFLLEMTV